MIVLAFMLVVSTLLPSLTTPPAPIPPAAQSRIRETVQALVDALDRNDFAPVEPRLAHTFTYQGHGGAFARSILRQIVSSYPKAIARHEVRRVEATPDGFRAEVAFFETSEGGGETHEIRLGPDFTLVQAEVAKIQLVGAHSRDLAALSGQPDRIPDRVEAKFELAGRLIVVEAEVAGRRGRFLVDSGSPLPLTLNSERHPDLARSAVPVELHGASGPIGAAGTGRVTSFRWAGMELHDVQAGFAPLGHLEATTGVARLSGLIGFGVLERFLVGYDYSARRLRLVRLDASGEPVGTAGPPPDTTVPIQMIHHIPVVAAQVAGRTLRLGIDSGAEAGLLRPASRMLLAGAYESVGTASLTGADLHVREGEVVRFERIEIGGLGYADLRFHVADLLFGHEVKIDGLLGYEFLSQRPATFNFRKGELYLGRQRPDGP